MSTPKWAVGMRRMAAGLYVDGKGALHIDGPEFCRANGYAPTRENVGMLMRAARENLEDVQVFLADDETRT